GPYAPVAERAVVTGGGSGIGRDVALLLAEAGVEVHVFGRRLEKLEETAALAGGGRKVIPHAVDIRQPRQVDAGFAAVEEQGGAAPLLVNAAGGAFLAAAENITPNGFAAVVAASLSGPFNVLRRWALPL